MPKNRRRSTHGSHARNLGTSTQFDSSIPLAHFGIPFEKVKHQQPKHKANKAATFFGDGTWSMDVIA